MDSEDVPDDQFRFAELFFGKGVDIPTSEPDMEQWLRYKGLGEEYESSSGGRYSGVGDYYTGIEPDSWHLTRWGHGYYLIYISDDGYLYSLQLCRENKSHRRPTFDGWELSARSFNSGKGWNCHYIYDVGATQGFLFPFINWNTNPFDTN